MVSLIEEYFNHLKGLYDDEGITAVVGHLVGTAKGMPEVLAENRSPGYNIISRKDRRLAYDIAFDRSVGALKSERPDLVVRLSIDRDFAEMRRENLRSLLLR